MHFWLSVLFLFLSGTTFAATQHARHVYRIETRSTHEHPSMHPSESRGHTAVPQANHATSSAITVELSTLDASHCRLRLVPDSSDHVQQHIGDSPSHADSLVHEPSLWPHTLILKRDSNSQSLHSLLVSRRSLDGNALSDDLLAYIRKAVASLEHSVNINIDSAASQSESTRVPEHDVNGPHTAVYHAPSDQAGPLLELHRERPLHLHRRLAAQLARSPSLAKHVHYSDKSVIRVDRHSKVLHSIEQEYNLALPLVPSLTKEFDPITYHVPPVHKASVKVQVTLVRSGTVSEDDGDFEVHQQHRRALFESSSPDLLVLPFADLAVDLEHSRKVKDRRRRADDSFACDDELALQRWIRRVDQEALGNDTARHSLALYLHDCPSAVTTIFERYLAVGIPDPAYSLPDNAQRAPLDAHHVAHQRQHALLMILGTVSTDQSQHAIIECIFGRCGGPLTHAWLSSAWTALLASEHVSPAVLARVLDIHKASPDDADPMLMLGALVRQRIRIMENGTETDSADLAAIGALVAQLKRAEQVYNESTWLTTIAALGNTAHPIARTHIVNYAASDCVDDYGPDAFTSTAPIPMVVREHAITHLRHFPDDASRHLLFDIASNTSLHHRLRTRALSTFLMRSDANHPDVLARVVALHNDDDEKDMRVRRTASRVAHTLSRNGYADRDPPTTADAHEVDQEARRVRRERAAAFRYQVSRTVRDVNELYRQRRLTGAEASAKLDSMLEDSAFGDTDFSWGSDWRNSDEWGVSSLHVGHNLQYDNGIEFRMRGLREVYFHLKFFDEILAYSYFYGFTMKFFQFTVDHDYQLGYKIETVTQSTPITTTCSAWAAQQDASNAYRSNIAVSCPCSVPVLPSISASFTVGQDGSSSDSSVDSEATVPNNVHWREVGNDIREVLFPNADFCMQTFPRSTRAGEPGRYCCYGRTGSADTTLGDLEFGEGAFKLITSGQSAGFDVKLSSLVSERSGIFASKVSEFDGWRACKREGKMNLFHQYRPINRGSCASHSVDSLPSATASNAVSVRSVSEVSFYRIFQVTGRASDPRYDQFEVYFEMIPSLIAAEECVHDKLNGGAANLNNNQFAALVSFVMSTSCAYFNSHSVIGSLYSTGDLGPVGKMLIEYDSAMPRSTNVAKAQAGLWEAFAQLTFINKWARARFIIVAAGVTVKDGPLIGSDDENKAEKYSEKQKSGKAGKSPEHFSDPEIERERGGSNDLEDIGTGDEGSGALGLIIDVHTQLFKFGTKWTSLCITLGLDVGEVSIGFSGCAGKFIGMNLGLYIDIPKYEVTVSPQPFYEVIVDGAVSVDLALAKGSLALLGLAARITLLPDIRLQCSTDPIGWCLTVGIKGEAGEVGLAAKFSYVCGITCDLFSCGRKWCDNEWDIFYYKVIEKTLPLLPAICFNEPAQTGSIVVDAAPAGSSSAGVWDGPSTSDIDWSNTDKTMSCSWARFSAPSTRVFRYKIAWSDSANPFKKEDEEKFYVDVGMATTHDFNNVQLEPRTFYYCHLIVVAHSGEKIYAVSDGFQLDGTSLRDYCDSDEVLEPCIIEDGIWPPEDAQYQWMDFMLAARWTPLIDPDSRSYYDVAIGTQPGMTDYSRFVDVGFSLADQVRPAAPLKHGDTYYYTIRHRNSAQLISLFSSTGIEVDLTEPPSASTAVSTARYSSANDQYWQTSTDSITFSFSNFWDFDSGVLQYRIACGSDAVQSTRIELSTLPGTAVASFTSSGSVSRSPTTITHTFTGQTLFHRAQYFCWVDVLNGARLYTTSTSVGFTIDKIAPVVTRVRDGDMEDWQFRSNRTYICGRWQLPEVVSGVEWLEWRVTAHDRTLTGNVTTVRSDIECERTRTISSADFSTITAVKCDVIDPVFFRCNCVTNVLTYTFVPRTLVAARRLASSARSHCMSFGGDFLPLNARITQSVQFMNGAGVTSPLSESPGFIVDTTPPIAGDVVDACFGLEDEFWWPQTAGVCARLLEWFDPESDVVTFDIAWGRTPGADDVAPFQSFKAGELGAASDLELQPNTTYYATVRAFNGAGLYTDHTSNGVTIAPHRPRAGRIYDVDPALPDVVARLSLGNGTAFAKTLPNVQLSSYTQHVCAAWEPFEEPISGIAKYEVGVGQSPFLADLLALHVLPNVQTTSVCFAMNLPSGTTPFVHVRATSRAGLQTSAYTDGYIIDTSAPRAGLILDGPGYDRDSTGNSTHFRAYWRAQASGRMQAKLEEVIREANTNDAAQEALHAKAQLWHDGQTAVVVPGHLLPDKIGRSCEDLKSLNASAPSPRDFAVVVDGQVYRVTCDMEAGVDGGWTHIATFSDRDSARWSDVRSWIGNHGFGASDPTAAVGTDYRSALWTRLNATDFMMRDSAGTVDPAFTFGGCLPEGSLAAFFRTVLRDTVTCTNVENARQCTATEVSAPLARGAYGCAYGGRLCAAGDECKGNRCKESCLFSNDPSSFNSDTTCTWPGYNHPYGASCTRHGHCLPGTFCSSGTCSSLIPTYDYNLAYLKPVHATTVRDTTSGYSCSFPFTLGLLQSTSAYSCTNVLGELNDESADLTYTSTSCYASGARRTCQSMLPSWATDGSFSSVFQTGDYYSSTIYIDLESEHTINLVRIHNRQRRSTNTFTVYYRDGATSNLLAKYGVSVANKDFIELDDVVKNVRFIYLERASGAYGIALEEIEVYSTASSNKNLALERTATATQSGSSGSYPASYAIDGFPAGTLSSYTVSYTQNTDSPWWQVDLHSSNRVDAVRVYNRWDGCTGVGACYGGAIVGFQVVLLGEDHTELKRSPAFNSILRDYTWDIGQHVDNVRLVRVELPSGNHLSLAEVQVFGVHQRALCASEDDPRDATTGACVWLHGDVPQGKQCDSSDLCASRTCTSGVCDFVPDRLATGERLCDTARVYDDAAWEYVGCYVDEHLAFSEQLEDGRATVPRYVFNVVHNTSTDAFAQGGAALPLAFGSDDLTPGACRFLCAVNNREYVSLKEDLGCMCLASGEATPELFEFPRGIAATTGTVDGCNNACSDAGFLYSVVRQGGGCYCAPSLDALTASQGCVACEAPYGETSQKCGGTAKQMSVFTRKESTYRGCYAHQSSDGTLPVSISLTTNAAMTPEVCRALCSSYAYFGVHAGTTCACGNAPPVGDGRVGDSFCNSTCGGDPSVVCGGPLHMSIYQTSKTVTPPATLTGVVASVLGDFAALRSDTETLVIVPTPASASACKMACAERGFSTATRVAATRCVCSMADMLGGKAHAVISDSLAAVVGAQTFEVHPLAARVWLPVCGAMVPLGAAVNRTVSPPDCRAKAVPRVHVCKTVTSCSTASVPSCTASASAAVAERVRRCRAVAPQVADWMNNRFQDSSLDSNSLSLVDIIGAARDSLAMISLTEKAVPEEAAGLGHVDLAENADRLAETLAMLNDATYAEPRYPDTDARSSNAYEPDVGAPKVCNGNDVTCAAAYPAAVHLYVRQSPVKLFTSKQSDFEFAGDKDRVGFIEPQSSIVAYHVCLGTRPRLCDVVPSRDVGLATDVTFDELSLVEFTRYYVTVNATNGLAMTTTSWSDGAVYREGLPEAGAVYDGDSQTDIAVHDSLKQFGVCFEAFSTPNATMVDYDWAIGTLPGLVDALYWQAVDTSLFTGTEEPSELICVSLNDTNGEHGLALVQGEAYVVVVRGRDSLDVWATGFSDGFMVDSTPPANGSISVADVVVHEAAAADGVKYLVEESNSLAIQWTDFVEDTNSTLTVAVSLSTLDSASATFVNVPTLYHTTTHTFKDLTLALGTTYYAYVRATNLAGLVSVVSSGPIVYDYTPPVAGVVLVTPELSLAAWQAALGVDISQVEAGATAVQFTANMSVAYVSTRERLCLVWGRFRDSHTPGAFYTVTVHNESASDAPNLVESARLAADRRHVCISVQLYDRQDYFVRVRLTTASGLTATASAPVVRAVHTGPTDGVVRDGASFRDVNYESCAVQAGVVCANWDGFVDLTAGGVVRYDVEILEKESSAVVQPRISVGGNTSICVATAIVEKTIVTRVWAYNAAGVFTREESDGVICDQTAPTGGEVIGACNPAELRLTGFYRARTRHTGVANVAFVPAVGDLCVRWRDFADDETPLTQYEIAFGTVAGAFDDMYPYSYRALQQQFIQGNASDWVLAALNFNETAHMHLYNDTAVVELNRTSVLIEALFRASVRATNAAGLTTVRESVALAVDPSAPVIGSLEIDTSASGVLTRELLNGQTAYTTSSTSTICAVFSGIRDDDSGVYVVRWRVSLANGTALTDWTVVSSVSTTKVCESSLSLESGTSVVIEMEAENGARTSVRDRTSSLLVDTEAPLTTGRVDLEDITSGTYVTHDGKLCARWSNWEDRHSGLNMGVLRLLNGGTSVVLEEVVIFNATAHILNTHTAPPPTIGGRRCFTTTLFNGASYKVSVEFEDHRTLSRTFSTLAVTVDRTAPVLSQAITLPPALVSSSVTVTWGVMDDESGISLCQWGLGSRAGQFDVMSPTTLSPGACTGATFSVASLPNAFTGSVTLRVRNGAGMEKIFSSSASSRRRAVSGSFTIVNEPPRAGIVSDGPDFNTQVYDFQLYRDNFTFSYQQFVEQATSMSIEVALVKQTLPSDKLPIDYNEVRASGTGVLTSTFGAANVLVDWLTSEASANMTGVHTFTAADASLSDLPTGVRLIPCVRARNEANLLSDTVCSNGIVIDTTAPTAGTVLDGLFDVDESQQASTTTMFVNVHGFYDATSAPLVGTYVAAVGTRFPLVGQDASAWTGYTPATWPQGRDMRYRAGASVSTDVATVTKWVDIGLSTMAQLSGLLLSNGQVYYAHVCGRNPLNLEVCARSDGVLVNTTRPAEYNILDVTPPRVFTVTSDDWRGVEAIDETTYTATAWSTCVDPDSSCSHCQVTVLETDTNATWVSPRIYAPALEANQTDLSLAHGKRYRKTVSCCNLAALCRDVVASTVVVDLTPPVARLGILPSSLATQGALYAPALPSFPIYVETRDDESLVIRVRVRVYVNATDSAAPAEWRTVPGVVAPEKRVLVQLVVGNNDRILQVEVSATNSLGVVTSVTRPVSYMGAGSPPTVASVDVQNFGVSSTVYLNSDVSLLSYTVLNAVDTLNASLSVDVLVAYTTVSVDFSSTNAQANASAVNRLRAVPLSATWTTLGQTVDGASLAATQNLTAYADGTALLVHARARNRASLLSVPVTSSVVVVKDSSAPMVRVWDGKSTHDVDSVTRYGDLACRWSVVETHSPLVSVTVEMLGPFGHVQAREVITADEARMRAGVAVMDVAAVNRTRTTRLTCRVTAVNQVSLSNTSVSDGAVIRGKDTDTATLVTLAVSSESSEEYVFDIPVASRANKTGDGSGATRVWERVRVEVPPLWALGEDVTDVEVDFVSLSDLGVTGADDVEVAVRVRVVYVSASSSTSRQTLVPLRIVFLPDTGKTVSGIVPVRALLELPSSRRRDTSSSTSSFSEYNCGTTTAESDATDGNEVPVCDEYAVYSLSSSSGSPRLSTGAIVGLTIALVIMGCIVVAILYRDHQLKAHGQMKMREVYDYDTNGDNSAMLRAAESTHDHLTVLHMTEGSGLLQESPTMSSPGRSPDYSTHHPRTITDLGSSTASFRT